MDPRDRPSETMDRAECAACGGRVPPDRIRVLARREDLAFAEVPCARCGTVGLAIFAGPLELDGDAVASHAPAVGPDDVLDMHLFLAAWTGDARSLVERPQRR
jgi:hypothetical protein